MISGGRPKESVKQLEQCPNPLDIGWTLPPLHSYIVKGLRQVDSHHCNS